MQPQDPPYNGEKNKPEIKNHTGKLEFYFTLESVRDLRQIESKPEE